MNELHLFAGAGGGILGGLLLGHTPVCAVEIDEYNRDILLQRQRDGILPRFPIWDDVRTFNGKPWRGGVDVVCGGFPCQDISFAGKRKGINGSQSGLWKEFRRIVCEVRPRFAFVENSGRLTSAGLSTVLGDLAAMGYDAEWGVFRASDVGAPHRRERAFILAHTLQSWDKGDWRGGRPKGWECSLQKTCSECRQGTSLEYGLWPTESGLERVVLNGVANGLDRHYAVGNGQVPAVVRKAWHILCQRIGPKKG